MTKNELWTQQEIDACVAVYVQLQEQLRNGEDINKANAYRTAEKKTNARGVKSVVYRFRNISAVLERNNRPWIQGMAPANSVGPGVQKMIEQAYFGDTPVEQTPHQSESLNPLEVAPIEWSTRNTIIRKQQNSFRSTLLAYYKKCVFTGCKIHAALEAAHIIPYSESGDNRLENGLLLRADIHRLFDQGKIGIRNGTIAVHGELASSPEYGKFHGKPAKLPNSIPMSTSKALLSHAERHKLA